MTDNKEEESSQIKILSPGANATFEESAEWYDYANKEHFWFQWRFKVLMQILKAIKIPTEHTIKAFDIGCGNGVLRSQLEASTQWNVDAADLNMSALKKVKAGRGEVFFYDIHQRKNDFCEAYDVVSIFDVIEHIEDEDRFMESVLYNLKLGGYLVINVPASQFLFSHYDSLAGHIRRYDKDMLKRLCKRCGLKVNNITYWGLSMVPILLLRRLWFKLIGLQRASLSSGFKPPNTLTHSMLKMLMKLETRLLTSPPWGTSLMIVAQKR